MMKPSQLIKNGWSQGALARNAQGEQVRSISDEAVQFCFIGAIEHCTKFGYIYSHQSFQILKNIQDQFPMKIKKIKMTVSAINDELIKDQNQAVKVMRKAEEGVL